MDRDQKCQLANELLDIFGANFFDDEGVLDEDLFDDFLALIDGRLQEAWDA